MKKLFGGLNITWLKLIIWAIIAGVYTGAMAIIPAARDTSFADISISFEVWILFGILIIMNSRSAFDSAAKCFVFFLISQPLVYLVQVPFSRMGWGIFTYYPPWFRWTLLTIPMGFIGYYMKMDKWWGMLILTPMLLFLGYHYSSFLRETISFFPNHLLSTIFCLVTLFLYAFYIFDDKKVRTIQVVIAAVIVIVMTVIGSSGKSYYNTTVLVSGGSSNTVFDDSYTVSLEDEAYGKVFIVYEENIEDYMVNAEFKKTGDTKLILESPEGEKIVFDLTIYRDSYHIEKLTDNNG